MRTLCAFVSACLLLKAPANATALTHRDVVGRALDSTVVLYADYLGPNGKMRIGGRVCSGVVIRSEGTYLIVATAAHCADGMADRMVVFFDGDEARIMGRGISQIADVAILYVRSHRTHPAVAMSSDLRRGDCLFIIGEPSGDEWSYSSGVSRNGREIFYFDGDPMYAIEAPGVWHGDSGGGVFDETGRLVGFVSAGGVDYYPSVVYVTPAYYAKLLLN